MPEQKEVIRVVKEWIAKAENDLTTAAHTLTLGEDCPTDTVCFHVQQCVEKYIKALLVYLDKPFPKTHDIRKLIKRLPPALRPEIESAHQDDLTEYATVLRYPFEGSEITLAKARKEVAFARRVRREIRRQLPRAALRRTR